MKSRERESRMELYIAAYMCVCRKIYIHRLTFIIQLPRGGPTLGKRVARVVDFRLLRGEKEGERRREKPRSGSLPSARALSSPLLFFIRRLSFLSLPLFLFYSPYLCDFLFLLPTSSLARSFPRVPLYFLFLISPHSFLPLSRCAFCSL